MKTTKFKLATPLMSVVILAGLITESVLRPSPASAEPYHARISQTAQNFPYQVGDWVGQNTAVPVAATTLLRPNVIISRRFQNIRTGHTASFLLVQCRDTRDILGHYPPICYPGVGWTLEKAVPYNLSINQMPFPAMEYSFSRSTGDQISRILVIDFMILPDGRIVQTMEELRYAARKQSSRFYGAAQVQMLFDPSIPDEERKQAQQEILGAATPILDEIRAGDRQ